jgi:hypothetical protein
MVVSLELRNTSSVLIFEDDTLTSLGRLVDMSFPTSVHTYAPQQRVVG